MSYERFLSHIDGSLTDDDCWPWPDRYIDRYGYGRFFVNGKKVAVHRWAYEYYVGPIPRGLVIDHLCCGDDCQGGVTCPHRRCANPWHMRPVTNAQNVARGRSGRNNGDKTHCPRGHEYTDGNTYRHGGKRDCRTCRRDRKLRHDLKKAAARHLGGTK